MSPSADVRRLEFDVDFTPGHAAAYLVPGDEPVLFEHRVAGARQGHSLVEFEEVRVQTNLRVGQGILAHSGRPYDRLNPRIK